MRFLSQIVFNFAAVLLLTSCGLSLSLHEEISIAPDYTSLDAWASHPEFEDYSDSSLAFQQANQFGVPVFFVYPTVHFPEKGGSWSANISNPDYQEAVSTPIKYQAPAFNVAGPVFTPYYRQAAYQVYNVAPNPTTARAYRIAYEDVKAAFDQFLFEIGPGTPFILAGHSQGTDHLEHLINSHLTPDQLDRLVVAYLVGMPIDQCKIAIPICESETQTGCFCSWRTYAEGTEITNTLDEACIGVTNPITWNTSKVPAEKSQNLGALVRYNKPIISGITDARIDHGVVYAKRPHFPGSWVIRTKNYHRGDINLYFASIQENVRRRLLLYLREHPEAVQ